MSLYALSQKAFCKTRLNHDCAMWQGHEGVPDNTAALELRAIPPRDSETKTEQDGQEMRRGEEGEMC